MSPKSGETLVNWTPVKCNEYIEQIILQNIINGSVIDNNIKWTLCKTFLNAGFEGNKWYQLTNLYIQKCFA